TREDCNSLKQSMIDVGMLRVLPEIMENKAGNHLLIKYCSRIIQNVMGGCPSIGTYLPCRHRSQSIDIPEDPSLSTTQPHTRADEVSGPLNIVDIQTPRDMHAIEIGHPSEHTETQSNRNVHSSSSSEFLPEQQEQLERGE
ncbi:hypothetical protein PMAYCL1PPCAC_26986, partial [Pristionchus mayeri]